MKTINFLDYQKDKGIANIKDEIQNLPIDANTKKVISGILDLNMKVFEVLNDTIKNSSNELMNVNRECAKSLEGLSNWTKDLQKLIISNQELLESLTERVKVLSKRIDLIEQNIK